MTAPDANPPAAGIDAERGVATAPERPRWSLGILTSKGTAKVPGSVLLFAPEQTSQETAPESGHALTKKRTQDGRIILDPQPEDSANDPLNWSAWRRDSALLSLGLYCMVGGGVTTILAAGFTDVASEYNIDTESVALTTGLYMAGMGVGGVFLTPTAILYGKRPVYLASSVMFVLTAVWCALSPSFGSLVAARVFQGVSVSAVECLPSATIAEIFFLHERAFRIGIYTLLLLGGKNLTPLVSAAIMYRWDWRWVFWILAIVVGVCGILLFFFVPETFWERAPTPRSHRASRRPSFSRRASSRRDDLPTASRLAAAPGAAGNAATAATADSASDQEKAPHSPSAHPRGEQQMHVEFAAPGSNDDNNNNNNAPTEGHPASPTSPRPDALPPIDQALFVSRTYTQTLRHKPAATFSDQLRPYHGRLNQASWFKVMCRPFVLFAYPAVLWSALTYACSVGWLIVISESVAIIYRDPTPYNFTSLQTGLVYVSPFVGGVLGTGVAGRLSDVIVQAMARRNGGVYEPEFRLVMVLPIMLSTCIGLMGFGWSAEEHNAWIVPTVFFGIVSFGCSLGSTTAVTYCVDSYRQYAGEALVTLNFAKNVCHGLVFGFFFTHWLVADGSRSVFIWIGIIQLVCTLTAIPMYIWGKRARAWTTEKDFIGRM